LIYSRRDYLINIWSVSDAENKSGPLVSSIQKEYSNITLKMEDEKLKTIDNYL